MSVGAADRWRIGVLASRVGVSETVLRAWETRYGLLQPARTAAGYRLYGPEDERRARAMVEARGRGVPAAQAAAEVLAADRARMPADVPEPGHPRRLRAVAPSERAPVTDPDPQPAVPAPARDRAVDGPPEQVSDQVADDASDHVPGGDQAAASPPMSGLRAQALTAAQAVEDLHTAMVAYDTASMHAVLDRVFATVSVESAIREVLFPFLRRVGEGWENGHLDVADEHFASDVVRGRLGALSFAAGSASGPLALLACTPYESHDIALKAVEVVLQRAGWRTRFLGAHTPLESLKVAADIIEPDVILLSGSLPAAFTGLGSTVAELVAAFDVYLAGRGADETVAERLGATYLPGDPVDAALRLSRVRNGASP
ncbi:MerR family transcriptional regulator [Nocardioides nanhaiensis]|uniref:MerR family transcriptional regulator n=1 Tax=Nocardioides nanhaiensis TaxID=1476871 RepID=A0ABP8VTK8_9ACTN